VRCICILVLLSIITTSNSSIVVMHYVLHRVDIVSQCIVSVGKYRGLIG